MAIGGIPTNRNPQVEQVRNNPTGNQNTKVSSGNEDPIYEGFKTSNGGLDDSLSGSMTYKSAGVQKKEAFIMSEENYEAAEEEAGNKLKEGDAAQDNGKGTIASQTTLNGEFESFMKDSNNQIDDNATRIHGQSADMQKSSSILQSNTAKQKEISSWIQEQNPTMEEMSTKIEELEAEAMSMIPQELGIEAETLEDAIAQLGEMVDPDTLAELQANQERELEIEARLEELDPENPDDQQEIQSLSGEQEALLTVLNDPENVTIMSAANTMSILSDYSAAIGELQASLNDMQANLDGKTAEADEINQSSSSEGSKIKRANDVVQATTERTQNINEKQEEKGDGFTKAMEITNTVGTVVSGVGTGLSIFGRILSAIPQTAAAGAALETSGQITSGVGGATTSTASIGNGIYKTVDAVKKISDAKEAAEATTAKSNYSAGTAKFNNATATKTMVNKNATTLQTNINEQTSKNVQVEVPEGTGGSGETIDPSTLGKKLAKDMIK